MDEGLKIDWANMPTYNTIMAVAVGAGLIGIVLFARELLRREEDPTAPVSTDGWAVAFGILGLILTATGLHMTLTWPLAAGGFAFDNIIFGETSLGFGVLLLGASFYLWKRGDALLSGAGLTGRVVAVMRPISIFVAGLGLGLIGIAVAGIKYTLFAAPAEEPISGEFADHPMVEAVFMSGLIALVGIGAVLLPFALAALARRASPLHWTVKVIGVVWIVAGVIVGLFGALNYFTHIGLIVNTM